MRYISLCSFIVSLFLFSSAPEIPERGREIDRGIQKRRSVEPDVRQDHVPGCHEFFAPFLLLFEHVQMFFRSIKEEISNIFAENKGRYGYRRITKELRNRNYIINHKTVQKLMKELGLVCRVRMKKYQSFKGEVGKIAPNLLEQDFTTEKPNEKWVTDVTEFSLFGQKLYLSPILDLHSGDIVSYTIYERPFLRRIPAKRSRTFQWRFPCAFFPSACRPGAQTPRRSPPCAA